MEIQISRAQDLTINDYALVDRMLVTDIPAKFEPIEIISPLLLPQSHLYPYLIQLNSLEANDWSRLMSELESKHKIESKLSKIVLLKSSVSQQLLIDKLSSMLFLIDEERQRNMFRYYDARVLYQLTWILNPQQLNLLLAGHLVNEWTFNVDGEWYKISLPQHNDTLINNADMHLPYDKLRRIGIINNILSKIKKINDVIKRKEVCHKIDSFLVKAEQCGLHSREDLVAFAIHGLNYSQDFYNLQDVIDILAIARTTPGYYHRATVGWNELKFQNELQRSCKVNNGLQK